MSYSQQIYKKHAKFIYVFKIDTSWNTHAKVYLRIWYIMKHSRKSLFTYFIYNERLTQNRSSQGYRGRIFRPAARWPGSLSELAPGRPWPGTATVGKCKGKVNREKTLYTNDKKCNTLIIKQRVLWCLNTLSNPYDGFQYILSIYLNKIQIKVVYVFLTDE